ncbi:YidC/Oxa1 family membrane protein insertase [Microbacterium terrae]|uniref:Membrane protein insertase YidC n=1 Tax=Microbacterium terrae TaxID=69369 RepID=A0A0M2HFN2_9MICO|nr:YidC/Oxa1 family membrane protein insertase [Microbacterium terrae]KJL45488.1 Membrane protein insertase MisCB precursor [Microbacterium terrae]MBP1078459.1 YidC/Oxa1 family membrane protein insertase [Microbacterium terrae]GLJ99359.1 protein translocase component YidC [Microbacterium terrae]
MDIFAIPALAALLDGAQSTFLALSDLLAPLAGASATACAIVLITLLVRAVLIPVGVSQARAEQARARLAPELRELQRRHRRDPERLQRETMRLYADHGTSPFAGCLPLLLQAPVVGLIYAVFLHTTIAGNANVLLAHELAGVPLGTSIAGAIGAGALDPTTALVCGAVVVLIAVVGEATRRLLRPPVDPAAEAGPLTSPAAVQMVGALQFATAAIALFVPLAAALYLLTTVAWTLGQRLVLRRRFPLPR